MQSRGPYRCSTSARSILGRSDSREKVENDRSRQMTAAFEMIARESPRALSYDRRLVNYDLYRQQLQDAGCWRRVRISTIQGMTYMQQARIRATQSATVCVYGWFPLEFSFKWARKRRRAICQLQRGQRITRMSRVEMKSESRQMADITPLIYFLGKITMGLLRFRTPNTTVHLVYYIT